MTGDNDGLHPDTWTTQRQFDQTFRVIESLVISTHSSGLTNEPALQQASACIEAVQVPRMSGKLLPAD